jgi:hypothetical protein
MYNTYLISFQIVSPSLPLQEGIIVNQIKSLGDWAHPTSSVWLIKTFFPRDYIMSTLKSVSGPNDRMLVMRVNNDWIASNLPNDVINWMKLGML